MPGGVLPPSLLDIVTLINELKADLNNLRNDFRSHDHGNTGAYAQATINLRGVPNTFSGTAEANNATTSSDLPVPPAH